MHCDHPLVLHRANAPTTGPASVAPSWTSRCRATWSARCWCRTREWNSRCTRSSYRLPNAPFPGCGDCPAAAGASVVLSRFKPWGTQMGWAAAPTGTQARRRGLRAGAPTPPSAPPPPLRQPHHPARGVLLPAAADDSISSASIACVRCGPGRTGELLEPTFQLSLHGHCPASAGLFRQLKRAMTSRAHNLYSATFIIGAILMVWGGIAWLLIEGAMRLLN